MLPGREEWRDGLGEAHKIPLRNRGLLPEAVASAVRVGCVGRPGGVEVVDPAIRTVVDREPQDGHVVGVHYAVHESDAHPVHDHRCGALRHFREPRDALVVGGAGEMRKIARDGEVDELCEELHLAASGKDLEVAEADEARTHATDNGPRLLARVAVVEHVAHDRFTGAHERERARGGDAQMVHRFAAEELPNARAQHRAPISGTRVGRRAGALELQFPSFAARVEHFAQADRAAIAKLPGPIPELMPAVVGGIGAHPGQERVTAEDVGELRRLFGAGFEADERHDVRRHRQDARRGNGRRRHRAPRGAEHLATGVGRIGIAGKAGGELVVEGQGHVGLYPSCG